MYDVKLASHEENIGKNREESKPLSPLPVPLVSLLLLRGVLSLPPWTLFQAKSKRLSEGGGRNETLYHPLQTATSEC